MGRVVCKADTPIIWLGNHYVLVLSIALSVEAVVMYSLWLFSGSKTAEGYPVNGRDPSYYQPSPLSKAKA